MIESSVKSQDYNKVDTNHRSIFSIQTSLKVPYSLIQTTKSIQAKLLKIFLTYNKYNSLLYLVLLLSSFSKTRATAVSLGTKLDVEIEQLFERELEATMKKISIHCIPITDVSS